MSTTVTNYDGSIIAARSSSFARRSVEELQNVLKQRDNTRARFGRWAAITR